MHPTGRHVKEEKKINVKFPVAAGLMRNPVVSPGGLLTAPRGKPCLCSQSSRFSQGGSGSSGQVTRDKCSRADLCPQSACTQTNCLSGTTATVVLSIHHLRIPWGPHSSLPGSPWGCHTWQGHHRWGPSLGCPFRETPSFRLPVCTSSIKNAPSKADAGLAHLVCTY